MPEERGNRKQSGLRPQRAVTARTRVPLSGYRDVFNVKPLRGKESLMDQYFHYWFFDYDHNGRRVHEALRAGYEFCPPEDYIIGQDMVYKSAQDDGSIIRIKETNGALYFMRIPMEWHLEDEKSKARLVDETEQDMVRKMQDDRDGGDYGEIKLDTSLGRETFDKD